jgi:lambda-carrageenase
VGENHVRVLLIDSGYLDPADRNAKIIVQNLKARECRDILSQEVMPIQEKTINLVVPMGSLRLFDIEHE